MPNPTQPDPTHAWAPYAPTAQQPWTLARAAHLHRRAGFGATWPQLHESLALGPAKSIDRLFQSPDESQVKAPTLAAFDEVIDGMNKEMLKGGDPHALSASWLYRMLFTPDPLAEKITLFWHNHFATSAAKVTDPNLVLDQHKLLRTHALGSFEAMVQAISRDVAMLIWLDSTNNRRIRPNENYAREIMELFCLGPGNYTEKDIKEVARAFTGWEVIGKKFVFTKYQHDEGDKTFLGQTGNFNGDDAVRIVLAQPAAPRFIAAKLVRYFVAEDPELSAALIEPLAQQLRDNGFQIGPVVRTILSSNIFFSDHAIARKVRSPVELAIGLLRSLEMVAGPQQLAAALDNLGQAVFFPPNVKGWDGGRTWISSATLLARANLVRDLLLNGQARFSGPGLNAQMQRDQATTPDASVDHLLQLLLAAPVPTETRDALIAVAQSGPDKPDQRLARTVCAIAALPEFQLA